MIKKRQEIGRGLRLAVDQSGERVVDAGFAINTLTVVANESYAEFVSALQKEIEEEDGIRFGVIELHSFANITIADEQGEQSYFGVEQSGKLFDFLKQENYIDKHGKVQDLLKTALKHNLLRLPEEFASVQQPVEQTLKKIAGGLDVKNAKQEHTAKPNKQVILGADFKELWDRIKYKTIYQVDFDLDKLVSACVKDMQKMLISRPKFTTATATIIMDESGLGVKDVLELSELYDASYEQIPDVLSYLQNKTQLTRKTLARILVESERLAGLKKNPQKFIENSLQIIQRKKMHALVDGIKYEKIGGQEFYAQELFLEHELTGYLEQNMQEANKSLYSHILYDSGPESLFAVGLEDNPQVKLYTKLPSWFKIDTPLGSYNPDWAILIDKDGTNRLYFVVETKSSLFTEDLRLAEQDKIRCGEAHFAALDSSVKYGVATEAKQLVEW
ncbi:MAG: hypothetical protein GX782_11435 [Gammaproteobacteria bacterium]|nr:hypothetical protein [Gammaproteobacteria bacterium]